MPSMPLWVSGFLGLVQGLTEFIPVSSNAHLEIASAVAGQKDAGAAFTAVLQLGSVAAVITYFRRDIVAMLGHLTRPRTADGKLAWQVALATVPIVVVGLLAKKRIEEDTRSLYLVCATLVGVGIVMWIIDQRAEKRGTTKPLAGLTWTDAALIGCAQVCALLPGVSRSGSTICAALLVGLSRREAARFSFLMSIPAVAGAGILESRAVFRDFDLAPIVVGVGVAAITSYAAIAWLMKWLGTHRLVGFAAYRIAAGLALLGALAAGVLKPL